MKLQYFSRESDPNINWDKVDENALLMLDNARGYAKVPFVITSSYRTVEKDKTLGGGVGFPHTEEPCTAFDILATTSQQRFAIIAGCIKAGFTRIGINVKNNHIHVDASKKLPNNVFWVE